jgi:sugar lactone lactonase YvrE
MKKSVSIWGMALWVSLLTASLGAQSLSFVPGVTRIAGTGTAGNSGVGGAATSALIHSPRGVVFDTASNLYFSDQQNNVVDRIDARTGMLTVFAGGGALCSAATDSFGDGCPATQAVLKTPDQLTMDLAGNLYIADFGNNLVRKVLVSTGVIIKVMGGGSASCTGSTDTIGDGCIATSAIIAGPQGLAVDTAGNIYESDSLKNLVRKVDASTGIVSKFIGTGSAGNSGDNGLSTKARVGSPAGLAIDAAGNLYVSDKAEGLIRKVNLATGIITTLAGTNPGTNTTAVTGYSGDGGPATSAMLDLPTGVVAAPDGNVYIADYGNNVVRKVDSLGNISTYAGGGTACSFGDSLGNGCASTFAKFSNPYAIAASASSSVIVADYGNNEVRSIALGNDLGHVTTNAGMATKESFVLATASDAIATETIAGPTEFTTGALSGCSLGVSIAANAACGMNVSFAPVYPGVRGAALLLTDASGSIFEGLRGIGIAPEVEFTGGSITTAAGTGIAGLQNGAATSAQFSANNAVAINSSDNIFIADTQNSVIRMFSGGTVTTVAGTGSAGHSGDGGAATSAQLNLPQGVAFDVAGGRLLIADTANHAIRALGPDGVLRGVVGSGSAGYKGDGGVATAAQLQSPAAVAADYAGNIYIADTGNNVVRRVTPGGVITTIAGIGTVGYAGDGAAASVAQLSAPAGLAVDTAGHLYIADTGNNVVRMVSLVTNVIITVAGTGSSGFSGDGAAASAAQLNAPRALALDAAGELYIADTGNDVVRIVHSDGTIATLAGAAGSSGYTGDNAVATAARLASPAGIALTSAGNLIISDTGNNVLRSVARAVGSTLTFGVQAVGTTSPAQSVSLTNTGNDTLTIVSVTATGPFAAVTDAGNCIVGTTLAAGASCTLGVTFTPTSIASASGTFTVADNALGTNATQTLPLIYSYSANATSTVLTTTPATASLPYGTFVVLTAAVSPQSGNTNGFTGSVSFTDGAASLGSSPTNAQGVATLSITPSLGTHSFTANFLGDANHDVSQSAPVAMTITQATTVTTLAANPTSAQMGTSVTLTAMVAPQIDGIPTGTVTFSNASGVLGTAQPLANGVATLMLTTLLAGSNTITAAYSGDTNFLASTSAGAGVTITTNPDYSISTKPSSITIPAGQSGAIVISLAPVFNYSGTVHYACGTLPANVQCRFIPATQTVAGTNTTLTTQLLVTTGGASATQAVSAGIGSGLFAVVALALVSVFRRKRLTVAVAGAVLLPLVMFGFSGCSSGTAAVAVAKPGTSTITVTASDSANSLQRSTSFTLIVQ